MTDITENTETTDNTEQSATMYNRGFASGGLREKFDTNGKLINFMDGLTWQAGLKPARCKAPERYTQLRRINSFEI